MLVVLFGFFVLGLLAYRAYSGQPPIPERIVDPGGNVVFTGADVRAGQGVFLQNGLMEFGSIFGHGAYLGPDFTADYLHRAATAVQDSYGGAGSDTAAQKMREEFKQNTFDERSGMLTVSDAQAAAFGVLQGHYATLLGDPKGQNGLRP